MRFPAFRRLLLKTRLMAGLYAMGFESCFAMIERKGVYLNVSKAQTRTSDKIMAVSFGVIIFPVFVVLYILSIKTLALVAREKFMQVLKIFFTERSC